MKTFYPENEISKINDREYRKGVEKKMRRIK